MKYIQVKSTYYSCSDVQISTQPGTWKNARPERYYPNLKERFIHNVLKKHFSFGQPYCVVCGKEEVYGGGKVTVERKF